VTVAGWLLMAASWLTIGSVVCFCLIRISRHGELQPPEDEDDGRS